MGYALQFLFFFTKTDNKTKQKTGHEYLKNMSVLYSCLHEQTKIKTKLTILSDLDRAEYSLLSKTPTCDFLRHPQIGVNGLLLKHFRATQRCGLVMSHVIFLRHPLVGSIGCFLNI